MKSTALKFLAIFFALTVSFSGCMKDKNNDPEDENTSIIPSKFRVDIPDAISYSNSTKSGNEDKINGGDLYEMLGVFIAIGDGAAQMVELIMTYIAAYDINEAITLTYTSDEDGRAKRVVVEEGATYEGKSYEFKLTITDTENEINADGGQGMIVYWNNDPVEGVAIFKPVNINVNAENLKASEAIYRIEYTEYSLIGYDAEMVVSISGLPKDTLDAFSVNNLKLWAGKKGNVVDLYGNSNHPYAVLIDSANVGFSWAFSASADASKGIAVAELGLPDNDANISTRAEILDDNSVRKVLENMVFSWFEKAYPGVTIDWTEPSWKAILDEYLQESNPPAFFTETGFVQSETAPTNDYTELINNIEDLTPFNPSEVNNLQISLE